MVRSLLYKHFINQFKILQVNMEEADSLTPQAHCVPFSEIPVNPTGFEDDIWADKPAFRSTSGPFKSFAPGKTAQFHEANFGSVVDPKTTFRIRAAAPKINLLKKDSKAGKEAGALLDIFQNFDEFVRGMIERGEDIDSEADLYLKLLSDYLQEDKETIRSYKRIEITVDTTNLTLQAFGDVLPQLIELKLSGSVIRSLRDIGTSFKSLKILWISRSGLRDLAGLLALQGLEELYASYNFVTDLSDIGYVEKLHTLDLEANNVSDLRQLSYVSPGLKSLTLTGNPVASDPKYLSSLLLYGKGLETIDDVNTMIVKAGVTINSGYSLNSPELRNAKERKFAASQEDDSQLLDKFRKLGLSEDIIRESIEMADHLFDNEPPEDEILRQSIKTQGFKDVEKSSLKELNKKKQGDFSSRPATADTIGGGKGFKKFTKMEEVAEESEGEVEEPKIEGYSELVTTSGKIFAGNPLKAAKHKKQTCIQKMGILDLIDQFKGTSEDLKAQINKKLAQKEVGVEYQNQEKQPAAVPVKAKSMLHIKRIKYVKK